MLACVDYDSDRNNDWECTPSSETDEEVAKAEEQKEIENHLFSQIHYYCREELLRDQPVDTKVIDNPRKRIRPLLRSKAESNRDYQCDNCSELGHLSRDCSWNREICILCGLLGHLRYQCPNVFCYNCKLPGHRIADCPNDKNSLVTCYRCNMFGHNKFNCPDIWRQYHYTTTKGPLIIDTYRVNKRIYCYNCGKKGHYGHACVHRTMTSFTYCTYPFVVSYDEKLSNQKPNVSKSAKKKKKSEKKKSGKKKFEQKMSEQKMSGKKKFEHKRSEQKKSGKKTFEHKRSEQKKSGKKTFEHKRSEQKKSGKKNKKSTLHEKHS